MSDSVSTTKHAAPDLGALIERTTGNAAFDDYRMETLRRFEAVLSAAVIFLGLSGYALTSKRDFSFMGGFLFAGVMVVFIAAIANIFLAMPALALAVLATATDGAVKAGIRSGDVLKAFTAPLGGKGGGRPQMAQGRAPAPTGGPSELEKALEGARHAALETLASN